MLTFFVSLIQLYQPSGICFDQNDRATNWAKLAGEQNWFKRDQYAALSVGMM